jgi:hypothetical protein
MGNILEILPTEAGDAGNGPAENETNSPITSQVGLALRFIKVSSTWSAKRQGSRNSIN